MLETFFRPGAHLVLPVIAAIGLSGCAAEVAYLPREAEYFSTFPQISDPELDHDELAGCSMLQRAYDMGGWPKGDDPETIRKIDEMVRERFVYAREDEDEWASRADIMVLTEHRWAGDCDDLSITVVALARCAGVPPDRLGLALAKTGGSDQVNHMVGFYTDPNGRSYSIGDTFSAMRPLLAPGQNITHWAFMDDLKRWLRLQDPEDVRDPSRAVIEANREE